MFPDEKEWDFKTFKILKKEYWDLKWMYIWEVSFEKWTEKFILQLSQKEVNEMFWVVKEKIPKILKGIIHKYNENLKKPKILKNIKK